MSDPPLYDNDLENKMALYIFVCLDYPYDKYVERICVWLDDLPILRNCTISRRKMIRAHLI